MQGKAVFEVDKSRVGFLCGVLGADCGSELQQEVTRIHHSNFPIIAVNYKLFVLTISD